MHLEWDESKRASNLAKHGLDFALAESFELEGALIEVDDRRDYGEVRLVAIGMIETRLHVLVFAPRGEVTRVIGLRKANARERKRYEEAKQA